MPAVLWINGFRFFFCSLENGEPPHTHVELDGKTAKFWLDLLKLARSQGFRPHELTRLRLVVIEYRLKFEEAWHDYFSTPA